MMLARGGLSKTIDTEQIPIVWINLERATNRRARMNWALKKGGWNAHRLQGVDATDKSQRLIPMPNLMKPGSSYPGLYKSEEVEPERKTSRGELACLASWKRLVCLARTVKSQSGWFLLMEDDVGASLAATSEWAHTLQDLIQYCPRKTLAIQLAPISAIVRENLAIKWRQSNGRCLAIPKEMVRSHGNGAVLLHKKAIKKLIDPFICISNKYKRNWHPLLHQWRIRPVADKWIYGALPTGSCQVATYPHFCLEARDSTLHSEHVKNFHKPSREITLKIWKEDQRLGLINAQHTWDAIK